MSAALINKFYLCFQQKDFRGMQACYHPEIEFSDSVFTSLKGKRAGAMWHMLLTASSDRNEPKITFNNIDVNKDQGFCHWEALYIFSLTGRKVHNKIDAKFIFKNGLIIRHIDTFSFWTWTRMAFGITGIVLGWSPFLKRKIRKVVGEKLDKFISKHAEYQ